MSWLLTSVLIIRVAIFIVLENKRVKIGLIVNGCIELICCLIIIWVHKITKEGHWIRNILYITLGLRVLGAAVE